MYNTDSVFVIGKDHLICQDYATSDVFTNTDSSFPIAIVCDGCSSGGSDGKGRDVDIGARLLARYVLRQIVRSGVKGKILTTPQLGWIHDIIRQAVEDACENASDLKISHRSLLSTVLVAFVQNDIATIAMLGDGVCFFKGIDGTLEYNVVTYAGNAPFYPYYTNSPERYDQYLNSKTDDGEAYGSALVEKWANGDLTEIKTDNEHSEIFIFEKPIHELAAFGVMSDGILSGLYSARSPKPNQHVNNHDMILKAANIPNFSGPFAQRRSTKYKSRNFHQRN